MKKFLVLLLLAGAVFGRNMIKPENHIVQQDQCPVVINQYKAAYSSTESSRGIKHKLHYNNATDRLIVAVQYGFVSFNIWNEFIDKASGVSIENIRGKLEKGPEFWNAWTSNCYGGSSFHVGFTYVDRVRFENGDFWECDKKAITAQMQEFEENFSIEFLEDQENE
jgi:hypothetical protein